MHQVHTDILKRRKNFHTNLLHCWFECLFVDINPENLYFASYPGLENPLGVYPLGPRWIKAHGNQSVCPVFQLCSPAFSLLPFPWLMSCGFFAPSFSATHECKGVLWISTVRGELRWVNIPVSLFVSIYAHTHTHTHIHSQTLTHSLTLTYTQTHIHTHTRTHTHAHTHTHTHTHTHAHTHTYIQKHNACLSFTQTYWLMLLLLLHKKQYTHIRIHTHAHTRTHTHTYSNTYTHCAEPVSSKFRHPLRALCVSCV